MGYIVFDYNEHPKDEIEKTFHQFSKINVYKGHNMFGKEYINKPKMDVHKSVKLAKNVFVEIGKKDLQQNGKKCLRCRSFYKKFCYIDQFGKIFPCTYIPKSNPNFNIFKDDIGLDCCYICSKKAMNFLDKFNFSDDILY